MLLLYVFPAFKTDLTVFEFFKYNLIQQMLMNELLHIVNSSNYVTCMTEEDTEQMDVCRSNLGKYASCHDETKEVVHQLLRLV